MKMRTRKRRLFQRLMLVPGGDEGLWLMRAYHHLQFQQGKKTAIPN